MGAKNSHTIATHDKHGDLTGSMATAGKVAPTIARIIPPAITVTQTVSESGLKLIFESERADTPARIKVVDIDGSELIIPENFAGRIFDVGFPFGPSPLSNHTRNVMREANSPQRFENLVNVGGLGSERLVAFGADTKIEGTPMAVFTARDGILGWELRLGGGTEVIALDFAPWDDEVANRNLAALMVSEDSPQIMAALLDPEATQAMTERMAADEIARRMVFPMLKVANIKRALSIAQLGTSKSTRKNSISVTNMLYMPLHIKINHQSMLVAMRISSPTVPSFAIKLDNAVSILPYYGNQTITPKAKNLADDAQVEWNRRFQELADKKGWRLVDLPYKVDTSLYHNISTFWITLLSPEQWEKVAPLAYTPAREKQNAGTSW